MINNPYAKKLSKAKQDDEDMYQFTQSSAPLIHATIGKHGAVVGVAPLGDSSSDFLSPVGGARLGTAAAPEGPRPMTSYKGAGYSSQNKAVFDPLQQGDSHGPPPPLVPKTADSPEHLAREMERGVNALLEQSAQCADRGEYAVSLEKAKEAGKKERLLCRHREKHNMADQINFDLTYAICFNLAQQYTNNKMYTEALNTYNIVVKNKQYPQAGRLRVNMGNIYYTQKKYPAAIKMYRMAMDQIGNTSRDIRFKIMRNIGNSFLKLGQFQDAIHSYEAIIDQFSDVQTCFNLLICYYALGDKEKMKKIFLDLLNCDECQQVDDDDDDDDGVRKERVAHPLLDEVRLEHKATTSRINRFLTTACRLIAPVIEKDLTAGFDWVIAQLKEPRRGTAEGSTKPAFPQLAMDVEIAKGIAYLKSRQIPAAIEVFKGFERADNEGGLDQAATNLSFLYFLEGDMKNSEKYADLAVKSDRYNAKALVNKANYLYMRNDFENAKELYLEAIGVEADCVEAIYNLGLTNKRLQLYKDALQAFKKLHRIVPRDIFVLYHLANLHEILGENQDSIEAFTSLHGMVPTDPKVLARLGTLYTKEDDETSAFHNFADSYAVYPVSMEVLSWLGVWYVKSDLYDEAIEYFQRAAEVEPRETKWSLMVASCYRRMEEYGKALDLYKKIHRQEPENVECLVYLCSICKSQNEKEYEEYSKLLEKAKRAQAQREQQQQQQQHKGQGGYIRDDFSDPHQVPAGAMHAPNTSPTGSPTHASRKGPSLADTFQPVISPSKQQPTFGSGNARDDEWGDDELGDDLLPM